jgi:hypothetical protein
MAPALGGLVLCFALSRAVLLTAAALALHSWPLIAGDGVWPGSPTTWLLGALTRWDGKWYLAIAQFGYSYHEGPASSMNFAPGYPALIHLVSLATGANSVDSLALISVVISNVFLIVALAGLYAVAREVCGVRPAWLAVIWLLAIPSTFFLSAAYPQSTFLAAVLGSFLFAFHGRWALAAVTAAAAATLRNYGVLVVIPLLWEYLEQRRFKIGPSICWLSLIPLAFAAWQAYFWYLTGDPLAMTHASEQWGRRLTAPWDMLRYYVSPTYWWNFVVSGGVAHDDRTLVDSLSVLLLGALVALSWRLPRRSLGFLATVLYAPMIATGGFVAIPRYALEVFPAFLVLAGLTSRTVVVVPLVLISMALAALTFAWFALGGWFT